VGEFEVATGGGIWVAIRGQRQSVIKCGNSTQQGFPRAPVRWAIAVSTQMTRSRLATMAAASAKLSILGPILARGNALSNHVASSSPAPFCKLTKLAPCTAHSGSSSRMPGKDRSESFSNFGLPFQTNPIRHPPFGRSAPQRALACSLALK
jgi:hypothetical protein